MFRHLQKPNFTSLCKPIKLTVNKCLRRCGQKAQTPPEPPKMTVTVCGANGQVGSIISFLLKQSPYIDILRLHDLDPTYGTAMDLSHIDTSCRVQSFTGSDDLCAAVKGAQIILICAGVGRAPGMSLNDLFQYNAPIVQQIAKEIINGNRKALIAILTNPINSLVPMVSKMFKVANCYDSRRIFGITTIDTMRACSMVVNDILQETADPAEFLVPVVGGHSPETIVPILSQTSPCIEIPDSAVLDMIKKIKKAGCYVTEIKQQGSARLSVALGAARFINNLIRGLKNENNVIELAYVYTNVIPGTCYFSNPIELGPNGVKNNLGLLKINECLEEPILKAALKQLREDIRKGESVISNAGAACTLPEFESHLVY